MTVLESINLSAKYLAQRGIESSRTNAELLLADILGCKRLDLYLSFDKPLGNLEVDKYREYIKRRGNFEPLQYITGKVEFYGLELFVNPNVLIPRPETELLVENVLKYLPTDKESLLLDIGCGSGNIPIALAVNCNSVKIFSTDINDEALKLSKSNAEKHSVIERIKFVKHNILTEELNNFPVFDIIVSNPPYVSSDDYASLQKEIRDYEPKISITDEGDGYTFYKVISAKSYTKIKEGGKLFFELALGQSNCVADIMKENNFKNIKVIKDYQNIDRVILGEVR
jgi:release factor glutamine methyltransferase